MVFLVLGVISLIAGTVLLFVQRRQHNRAFCLRLARAATAGELKQMAAEVAQEIGGGSWRDYVKVAGEVLCDRPLTAPLSQKPCVYYTMSVKREYEETVTRQDKDGKSYQTTQSGSETMSSDQQSVPFRIQDNTGELEVNLEGADVDAISVVSEFRPAQGGPQISFGSFSFSVGNNYGGRRTLGYRYSESILPLERRATIVATVADQGHTLVLQKPDEKDKHFVVSLKTAEDMTKAALKQAKVLRIIMIVCLSLGVLFVLIGLVSGI